MHSGGFLVYRALFDKQPINVVIYKGVETFLEVARKYPLREERTLMIPLPMAHIRGRELVAILSSHFRYACLV